MVTHRDDEHLLRELLAFANETHQAPVRFSEQCMLKRLGWSQQEFAIVHERLGPSYCSIGRPDDRGEDRWHEINVNNVQERVHQLDQENLGRGRHRQWVSLTIVGLVLAATTIIIMLSKTSCSVATNPDPTEDRESAVERPSRR